jgi:hypothetical protein
LEALETPEEEAIKNELEELRKTNIKLRRAEKS